MGIQAALLLGATKFIGFIRPDSDVETSDWTATPLWSKLDETSPDDATTQITSTTNITECPTTETFDFEVGMSNPASPPTGQETVTIRVRALADEVIGSMPTKTLLVQVKETTTVRASSSFTLSAAGWTTPSFTMSQAEKDAVGNWDNMRVRCAVTLCLNDGANDEGHAHVTWIEMEFS